MAWFELHIRNRGAGSMISHHLQKGHGSRRPPGPYFSPTRRPHRWWKAARRGHRRPCWPRSGERDRFLWAGRSFRTYRHWRSWYRSPQWTHLWSQNPPTFLTFSSSMKIHQDDAFWAQLRLEECLGESTSTLGGGAGAKVISVKAREGIIRALAQTVPTALSLLPGGMSSTYQAPDKYLLN